ncbi:MAG TPA: hypothetical protein VLH83_11405 [Chthoniobacterales bacterium]|nr:hypothetical protein [Chthoniobacterales bacterium]
MNIQKWKLALSVAALLALNTSLAHAATCSVPSVSYPTIQSAVDDTSCTIVNVAPGIYAENIFIARSLTLNGAQAGLPVAGRISGGPGESTIVGANPTGSVAVVTMNASNVTVDGFTLRNPVTSGAAIGIQLKSVATYATIRNNIVDGIDTADPAGVAEAIFIEGGSFSALIEQNLLENISSTQSTRGFLMGDGNPANPLSPMTIQNNTITGVTSTNGGAYGLLLVNPLDNAGLFISSNDFGNLEGSTLVHGLSFESTTSSMSASSNNFTNLIGPTTDNKAIWFSADDPDVYRTDVSGSNFNLTVASYGVAIDPSVNVGGNFVNAGCCWWGSADGPGPVGPGHGARVSPNVLYPGWRLAPAPVGGCVGTNVPTTEAQCKNGGWTTAAHPDGSPFKNQGDCVQFVNNGK